jgi:H+/Cl- antiporter ClcA
MSETGDVEPLLRRALAPVEPPDDLSTRVTHRLQSISDLAAEELESWEIAAMRDPRNWVRPAVAVVGGTAAGAGLVLLRLHQRHRARGGEDLIAAGERAAGRLRKMFDQR